VAGCKGCLGTGKMGVRRREKQWVKGLGRFQPQEKVIDKKIRKKITRLWGHGKPVSAADKNLQP